MLRRSKRGSKAYTTLEIIVAGPKEDIPADMVDESPAPMVIWAWSFAPSDDENEAQMAILPREEAPAIDESAVQLSDEQFCRLALSLRPLLQQVLEQEPILDFLSEHNGILGWLLDPRKQAERPSHVPLRIPSDLFARAISSAQPEVEGDCGTVVEAQEPPLRRQSVLTCGVMNQAEFSKSTARG
jgi:hypothetical protein